MTTQNIIDLTEEIQELKTELTATIDKYNFNTRVFDFLHDIIKDYEIEKFTYADYFIVEWNKHADIKKELEKKIIQINIVITEKEKELYNATMSIL